MKRVRASPAVKRQIITYFGSYECVVTGNTEGTQLHHIDHNPERSIFENLLPLDPTLNYKLFQYVREFRASGVCAIDPVLEPDILISLADKQLLLGHAARAYGIARIAVYIAQDCYKNERAESIAIAADCLHALRHRFDIMLAFDLLNSNVLKLLESGRVVETWGVSKWRLLFELACLFQDHGAIEYSHKLFLKCEDNQPRDVPQKYHKYSAALARRLAMSYAHQKQFPQARLMMDKARVMAQTHYRQILHMKRAEAKLAKLEGLTRTNGVALADTMPKVVDESGKARLFRTTGWGAASFLIQSAVEIIEKKQQKRLHGAKVRVQDAAAIINETGSALSPLIWHGNTGVNSIQSLLSALNMTSNPGIKFLDLSNLKNIKLLSDKIVNKV